MKNSNLPILKKLKKKDNICNICQQQKSLSEDHVPPKACPPIKKIIISKLTYHMIGDRSFRSRISQNGITYQTICHKCNNQSLHQFNKFSSGDRANIQINLRSGKSSTWPEECLGLENILFLGRTAEDSVYAIPKIKKSKNKKIKI